MPDETLTPDEIKAAEELAAAQKELAWQLTSIGVNTATVFDPTGLSNIPAMGMSLYEGDFLGAGLSLIGLIPIAGKISDAAKEARVAGKLAKLRNVIAGLTARMNQLRKLRADLKEAQELEQAAKTAKELKEAQTATSAKQAVKATADEAKAAPEGCLACEEAAAEKAAKSALHTNPSGVVKERVESLKKAIPEKSQGRVTMSAAVVEDVNGNRSVLIGTSEPKGYLRPGVTLNPDEKIVGGLKHAEQDLIDYAKSNDLKVIDIGATRPVCPACVDAIKPSGANISTPLKKVPSH